VAFKPPATIGQIQTTTNYNGIEGTLEAKGRHVRIIKSAHIEDPCVMPRAVPIVEGMAALVLME